MVTQILPPSSQLSTLAISDPVVISSDPRDARARVITIVVIAPA